MAKGPKLPAAPSAYALDVFGIRLSARAAILAIVLTFSLALLALVLAAVGRSIPTPWGILGGGASDSSQKSAIERLEQQIAALNSLESRLSLVENRAQMQDIAASQPIKLCRVVYSVSGDAGDTIPLPVRASWRDCYHWARSMATTRAGTGVRGSIFYWRIGCLAENSTDDVWGQATASAPNETLLLGPRLPPVNSCGWN
jgi:hypothetical protein